MTKTYSERVQEELAHPDTDVTAVLQAALNDYELQAIALEVERQNVKAAKNYGNIWYDRAVAAEQFECDVRALVEHFMEFKTAYFSGEQE